MKKITKELFLAIFFLTAVLLPAPYANAQNSNCTSTDTNTYCMLAPIPIPGSTTAGKIATDSGFAAYLIGMIKLFMGVIGVIAVFMIVVGGIEYMSTVSVSEKSGAKTRITNALLGLLLALSSFIILYTINPALTEFDINLPGANLTFQNTTSSLPYASTPTAGSGTTTPGGKTPTTTSPQDNYNSIFQAAAKATGVDCTLGKAVASVEDQSGNPKIYSSYVMKDGTSGHAYGNMQLTPATYKDNGGTGDITDPTNNINAGFAYLHKLQTTGCNGSTSSGDCNTSDPKYIAAAYNGGAGVNGPSADCGPSVTQWECAINRGGLQQTYDYANQVMANYNKMIADKTGC